MTRTTLTPEQAAKLAQAERALADLGLSVAQAAHLRLAADLCAAWAERDEDDTSPDPLAMAERWAEQGEAWDASSWCEQAACLLAD